MSLIKDILSRHSKDRIKANIDYMNKTQELLEEAVEGVRKTSKELYNFKNFEKDRIIKRRKIRLNLAKWLKNLNKSAAMYFRIDDMRNDYTSAEKCALGELKTYWHSIKLNDLPATQWNLIKEIIEKNKLGNVKTLVIFDRIELTFEQYKSKPFC